MYEVMKTNLPKETMAFPGHPFPHHLPSFITHQQVLQYITKYGDHIDVQLKTRVLRVERNGERWMVEVEKEGEKRQTEVDVLFVCNGHYSHPNRPFDEKRFTKGSIVHSHDYRSNRGYRDRKVAVCPKGPKPLMRMYHMLGADQWDYFEELQQRAKRDDPFFSSMVRHIFELTAELRKDDIAAYKDFSFHIVDGHLCVEQ
ncbi:unnamed protein product, partial [Mesorhabditis spiculigera]